MTAHKLNLFVIILSQGLQKHFTAIFSYYLVTCVNVSVCNINIGFPLKLKRGEHILKCLCYLEKGCPGSSVHGQNL